MYESKGGDLDRVVAEELMFAIVTEDQEVGTHKKNW